MRGGAERTPHQRGPLPRGGRRPGQRRAAACWDPWRAGLHHPHQAGHAGPALPDRRHRRAHPGAVRLRPHAVRMSKIVGRADDMLVIRGVNVYPSEVEAVLLAEPAVGPQYLLVVDRTETMPSLVVVCELEGGGAAAAQRERTRAAIAEALERRLALRPEVRVLPAGTLPRIEMGKVQRVVQRTADHDPLRGLDA